jgi:hypothetical protein
MCEQYLHLLIPRSSSFVPSLAQIDSFIKQLVALGTLSANSDIKLSQRLGQKTRTIVNPFTGEKMEYTYSEWRQLSFPDALASGANELVDFQVYVESFGRPDVPPVSISFADEYYLTLGCHVSSVLRSTSSILSGDSQSPNVPKLWEPCSADLKVGYFTNPGDGTVIEVPK